MCIEYKKTKSKYSILDYSKFIRTTIIILAFTITLTIKLWQMDFSNIEIDVPTLLSICLAFFAIWLSIVFYFKADEANNRFYHHTYEFTKQTSEILGRLESGFGEKLDSVKENMKYFSNINPSELKKEKEKLEADFKKEKEKLKTDLENAENKINEVVKKSKFSDQQKEELLNQINKLKNLNEKLRENQFKRNQLNKNYTISNAIIKEFYNFLKLNYSSRKIEKIISYRSEAVLLRYFNMFLQENSNLLNYLKRNSNLPISRIFINCFEDISKQLKDYFYEEEEEEEEN